MVRQGRVCCLKALLQRVSRAAVRVDGEVVGRIDAGLLVLLGVERGDGIGACDRLARKTAELRIFADLEGRMNLSVVESGGSVLVISQFTLIADTRRGRRPSYARAASPEKADALYRRYVERLREIGLPVETGIFQAMMQVELVNDGPVTILLEKIEASPSGTVD